MGSAVQRRDIVAHIGNLIFTWSNNESLFIYLLQVLLDTDFESAAITFVTLNTTRARVDLIRRLAKKRVRDAETIAKLERLIERFNECTKLRNELNHSIYELDENGRITHTNELRFVETKTGVKFAARRPVDAARLKQIDGTVRKLIKLNRDLWAFMPELEKAARAGGGQGSAGGRS
ncbi:MAG: hypothetical protein M5U16_03750 [Hyphomicrobium sp.]|nr:hypothetical protein [Hyphomicrobium sp.]